jgi:hypothetical protein
MNREVHVRFWEGVGVRLPRATRLVWQLNAIRFSLARRPIPRRTN